MTPYVLENIRLIDESFLEDIRLIDECYLSANVIWAVKPAY